MKNILTVGVATIILFFLCGCVYDTPTYTMAAGKLDSMRSDLGKIGVVISKHEATVVIRMPAKGKWGGAKRGFVNGAIIPIGVGFVIPVPGGSMVGALLAPVTGVVGAVKGSGSAPPVEEFNAAEKIINNVITNLREERWNIRSRLAEEIVRQGVERAGLDMVYLSDIGPQGDEKVPQYDKIAMDDVKTVLEVRLNDAGLWGFMQVDPPSYSYVDMTVRLIDRETNREVLSQRMVYIGELLSYKEWSQQDGVRFHSFITDCPGHAAEKIVDDFFLVEPLY